MDNGIVGYLVREEDILEEGELFEEGELVMNDGDRFGLGMGDVSGVNVLWGKNNLGLVGGMGINRREEFDEG